MNTPPADTPPASPPVPYTPPNRGPRVTVGMPCWNAERFVDEAFESILAQDYFPLQVVVFDDNSEDNTLAIIEKKLATYKGLHRIEVYRNIKRHGIENYNRIMEKVMGDFVIIAHADDVSYPQRVATLVDIWQRENTSLVCSNADILNADGSRRGSYSEPSDTFTLTAENMISAGWVRAHHGATLGWEPTLWRVFGRLQADRSAVSTDWILPFRAMLLKGVSYHPQPLLGVRAHHNQRNVKLLADFKDELVDDESNLANRLAQHMYMLRTIDGWRDGPAERKAALRAQLLDVILGTAELYAMVRNRLLHGRRRPRWVSVDAPS